MLAPYGHHVFSAWCHLNLVEIIRSTQSFSPNLKNAEYKLALGTNMVESY